MTGEALDQQIAELQARQQAEPQNVDVVRRLGLLCEQKDNFEAAIKWYQRAAAQKSGSAIEALKRLKVEVKP